MKTSVFLFPNSCQRCFSLYPNPSWDLGEKTNVKPAGWLQDVDGKTSDLAHETMFIRNSKPKSFDLSSILNMGNFA